MEGSDQPDRGGEKQSEEDSEGSYQRWKRAVRGGGAHLKVEGSSQRWRGEVKGGECGELR